MINPDQLSQSPGEELAQSTVSKTVGESLPNPGDQELETITIHSDMWPIGQAFSPPFRPSSAPALDGSIDAKQTELLFAKLSRRFALSATNPAAQSAAVEALSEDVAANPIVPQVVEPPPLPPEDDALWSSYQAIAIEPAKPTHRPVTGGYFIAGTEAEAMNEPPVISSDKSMSRELSPRLAETDEEEPERLLKDYTVGFGELMQPQLSQALNQLSATPTEPSVAQKQSQAKTGGYFIAKDHAQTEEMEAAPAAELLGFQPPPPRARPVADVLVPNPNRKTKGWKSWFSASSSEEGW